MHGKVPVTTWPHRSVGLGAEKGVGSDTPRSPAGTWQGLELMAVSAGDEQLRTRVQVWLQLSPRAALRAAGTLQSHPLQCSPKSHVHSLQC